MEQTGKNCYESYTRDQNSESDQSDLLVLGIKLIQWFLKSLIGSGTNNSSANNDDDCVVASSLCKVVKWLWTLWIETEMAESLK